MNARSLFTLTFCIPEQLLLKSNDFVHKIYYLFPYDCCVSKPFTSQYAVSLITVFIK